MRLRRQLYWILSGFFVVIMLAWSGLLWLFEQGQEQTLMAQSQTILMTILHYRTRFENMLALPQAQQQRVFANLLPEVESKKKMLSIALFDHKQRLLYASHSQEDALLVLNNYQRPVYGLGLILNERWLKQAVLTYLTPLKNNNDHTAYLKIRFVVNKLPQSYDYVWLVSIGFFLILAVVLATGYFRLRHVFESPLNQLRQALAHVKVHDMGVEHDFGHQPSALLELQSIQQQLAALLETVEDKLQKLENKNNNLVNEIQQRIQLLEQQSKTIADLELNLQTVKQNNHSMLLAQSEFTANISQQLRTPMNAILGMVEMLLASEVTETVCQQLEVIQEGSQQVHQIIENLMTLSTIESGNLHFKNQSFDLQRLLQQVVMQAHVPADKKLIPIEIEFNETQPSRLRGDVERIQNILAVLLNHALMLTQQAAIRLQVKAKAKDAHYAQLKFMISYQGNLIKEKNKVLFFSETGRFNFFNFKLKNSELDLTMCHQLAQLMGGKIGFDSQQNQHCLWLKLLLPISQSPDKTKKILLPVRSVHDFQQRHILLVEDNYTNQLVAKLMLEKLGCRVTLANNGEEALALYQNQNFDLILMDVQMPVMDGLNATKKIREQERLNGKHHTIIAITANALQQDKQQCFDVGMDDFLAKPISQQSLVQLLDKWVLQKAA